MTLCFLGLFVVLTSPGRLEAKSAVEVFEQASKSVVVVYNLDDNGNRQQIASGVIMPNGDVATNHHVIQKAARLAVVYNGKSFSAKPRYSDQERDICMLEVPGLKAPRAVIGNSRALKIGSRVYAIGSPRGLELTLSDGIISGFREVDGGYFIQTTAPISSGSSGGGLFDEEGCLIGLPTFFLTEGQQLNFAVPVEWVLEIPKRQNSIAIKAQSNTERLKKTIILEQKKDWLGMLRECSLWIKAHPKSSDAWYCSGLAYSRIGDIPNAIKAFKYALQIHPCNSAAWNDLGVAYGYSGMKVEAIEAYRKAVMTNRNNASAWHNLGIQHQKNNDRVAAGESFRQALRINPNYISAWFNLGVTLKNEGSNSEAIDAFEQVVRLNRNNAFAWYNIGVAYREIGDSARAIDAFQQALNINPNYDACWMNLAYTFGLAGKNAEKFRTYCMAISINPNNADAWVGLGVDYYGSGQTDKAVEAYKQALSINSKNVQALFNLGQHYASQNKRETVRNLYVRLKEIDADLAKSYLDKYIM
ncbi:MAG: tetratricopeptide repeat protein [Chlorobiaceae bacterium]|nr:tetratricopeptide repeat protein [Chlorobiaceae bacterium]